MTVNLSHLASSLAKQGTAIDLKKKKTVLEFTQPASYESQAQEHKFLTMNLCHAPLGTHSMYMLYLKIKFR